MLRALGALERIEVGPARAEEAVGGDQRLDVDLLARDGEVGRAGLDGERIGLGALREGLDDRRVRDVAGVGAVGGRHVLQRVEVGAPVVRHGAGVLEIGLVHLLHVRRVAAEQVGVGPVLFHHLSLTFHPGFQGYDGLINLPRPGSAGWRIANALLATGRPARGHRRTIGHSADHECSTYPESLPWRVLPRNHGLSPPTRPCHALSESRGTMSRQVIRLHPAAPAKPRRSRALQRLRRLLRGRAVPDRRARQRPPHGRLRRACRGIQTPGCYRCGLVGAPQTVLPWLPSALAPLLSRLARRWISAASGCDSSLVVEAASQGR